jgi:hypothetical protein
MANLHDLQSRAGQLERTICESDDQHGDLLGGLRDGLSTIRDRLIQLKIENDRLAEENTELKQIIEQLLGSVEGKSRNAMHDTLKDLDVQLNVLLRLSDDESAAALGDLERLAASTSHGADLHSDEPAGVVARETNSASSNEPSSLEEIQDRVRRLSEQFPEDHRQANSPISSAAIRDPSPEPIEREEPVEPHGTSTSMVLPSPASDEDRQGICGPDDREKNIFNRPIEALAHKARRVLPKTRMRFDAEVDYAVSILRRLKGGNQPFSIEEVRDLISGKFGLGLTSQHDAQIAASLSKQDDLKQNAKDGKSWKFKRA